MPAPLAVDGAPPDDGSPAPSNGFAGGEAAGVQASTQDVRFAVDMSGGVSLAVWMGGVARELNLLQQASNQRQRGPVEGQDRPGARLVTDGPGSPPATDYDDQGRGLYLNLLRCLDLTVTVDVLAGTSAGGINAALLGLSSAAGADLAMLRNLWLTTGSFDLLLRDPGEKNPPSLLQGDKVLFSQLAHGIENVYHGRHDTGTLAPCAPPGQPLDTTVLITTTMMSGETSRFTDDYGTVVPDVDHHGLFTFAQQDLAPGPDEPSSLTALALAARSSASFPGAFEPSFVPIHGVVTGEKGVPSRPDMASFANMTRSHWVADGGLLANRPLAPLLSAVFARRATREVRRVLAFVVPDGGAGSHAGQSPPADQWAKPLTMVNALKMDLDAQLSQSIASELQLIRAHNEQLTATKELRRSLAEMGARLLVIKTGNSSETSKSSDAAENAASTGTSGTSAQREPEGLVTSRLLVDYQIQQGRDLAHPLIDAIMREVSAMERLPEGWADDLSPAGPMALEPGQEKLATAVTTIMGAGWNPVTVPAGEGSEETAGQTEVRSHLTDEEAAWTAWDTGPDPIRAARFGLPVFRAAEATSMHLIRLGYQRATSLAQRQMIDGHHAAITAILEQLPGAHDDVAPVAQAVRDGATTVAGQPRSSLMNVAIRLADRQRKALLIGPDSSAPLMGAWTALSDATIDLINSLASMATVEGRKSRREAARTLAAYLDYLGPAATSAAMTDRLLNLTIAERALQPAQPGIDQPVEFIQVSANTRTSLSQQDSVSKLRGVELHHFAAFYKSSWRAYDWMWGRLDGSGWLVHILLDPRRILALIENRYDWPREQRAREFARVLREALGLPAGLPGDVLERDLDFLNDENATIPVSLPSSALFLVRAWQELIAANELPTIAHCMVADDQRLAPAADAASASGETAPAAARPSPGRAPSTELGPPAMASRVRRLWHREASPDRRNQPGPRPDAWVTTVLGLHADGKSPADLAVQLPYCPVRWQTLAGEERTPAFLQTATKAAAVAAAALTAAPEAPKAIVPILTSARSVTRTGYLATKALGGNGLRTLLAGLALAVIGIVLASQRTVVVGLTGTVIALTGLYLIALGAWGIRRGLLGSIIAITALATVGALTLSWVRTELWGKKETTTNGLVPRDVLPWLRSTWWAGLALLAGVLVLAILPSIWIRLRRRAAGDPGQELPSPGYGNGNGAGSGPAATAVPVGLRRP